MQFVFPLITAQAALQEGGVTEDFPVGSKNPVRKYLDFVKHVSDFTE